VAARAPKEQRFQRQRQQSSSLLSDEAVGFSGVVRDVYDDSGMAQNFISCDRGQVMLLPPALTDWLPEDHLVWTVLGAVEQMDLEAFYGAYRANGQGRAAYDPEMMAWLRCCCTRMRSGCGPRDRSSGRAVGMWLSR
jgi:hypothetical protein